MALGERIGVVHITLHKAGRRFSLAATKSTAVTGVQLVRLFLHMSSHVGRDVWLRVVSGVDRAELACRSLAVAMACSCC